MEDQHQEEGAEKTMEHYVKSNPNAQRSAIVRPEVPSNFEIKPQILSMIQNNYQFGGIEQKVSITHCHQIQFEHEMCCKRSFLEHDEQLCEAWERIKELLRKCPNHGIPRWMQMEIFYHGITVSTRSLIDVAAGGTMNKKTPNEVYELIEEMASNMCNDPYSNTYNPGWRSHPNFSWSNNNNQQSSSQQPNAQTRPPPGFQRAAQEQEQKVSFKDIVSKFLANQEKRDARTESRFQTRETSIENLKIQMGQLVNVISGRNQGTLSSNSETNPKEQIKAITLRSGKVLEGKTQPQMEEDKPNQQQDKEREEQDEGKESSKSLSNAEINVDTLPYPERAKKDKLEDKFSKFIDIFKKLEINISFVEALMQMSQYTKFLKEVLSGKRRIEEQGTVILTESCSAILKNQLPKLKAPESFTIPCEFRNFKFNKVLCDLGASINLMPLSICRKLNLGELKETNIMLQFADRSTKMPNGLIEDVLVKIGKFIYPSDFVVLDMEVDWELPLILGRPFLATAAALIDVKQGKLTLRLNDEEIVFDIKQAIKSPSNSCDDTCYFIDVIDECAKHVQQEVMMKDSLERCLAQSCTKEDDDPLMQQEVEQLEAEGNKDKDEVAEIKDPSKPELKPLPSSLKYVYLKNYSKPVTISSCLNAREEKLLIEVLSKHKKAIGWTISNIKGINPTTCMHKILMEDSFKPTIQPQRRLNPTLQEVDKKEVVKLLDAGIIYPISDSKWVSPVQVVPKKGGITVIKNSDNELIPTRTVTGWRVCIDYRKLNSATRKDHFSLPFIDQMLERLASNKFYYFLDGYSGYFQIPIAPEDQENHFYLPLWNFCI
ncbi:hypothetical protein H6P81_006360 [Aristolochia fimbriata]|uniref:Reverse transcriptase n=1 Tax=Aristolochia fimbriata TaxID=158543 RepID=A0AAV7EYA2_ARIFI|nr:hypothetical protein H6P81_006360 [Aristolochia fimbriata]